MELRWRGRTRRRRRKRRPSRANSRRRHFRRGTKLAGRRAEHPTSRSEGGLRPDPGCQ